jgi:hypothetical protein
MNKSWMLMILGALLAADGLATSARAQSSVVYAAEYNQPTNRFGTINLLNGNFTTIASIGKALINDIAYCPTNGVVYGISNSSTLVTFNITNGAITKVANLSVSGIESLAFRPSDGTLFGATQSKLYTINPANGTATSVGSYGSPRNLGTTGQNIRFAQDGNLYLSNTSTNTDIYRINTSTGAATWMGEAVGYPYLMLQNGSQYMYGVFVNLGTGTDTYPELANFDLTSFVAGGTNADGSTHQISLTLVGAGTNFPANVVFSGNVPQPVTNLTVAVSAAGPVNQTVCPGDGAVFSTVASGTGPYSYAWMKNGSALSGQTNSSLTLMNVSASDAATYSVIVSGAIGTVTNSATLTMNTPVTVTAAPLDQASVAGGSATFNVAASGTGLKLSMVVQRLGHGDRHQPDPEQSAYQPVGRLHGDCQRHLRQRDQQRHFDGEQSRSLDRAGQPEPDLQRVSRSGDGGHNPEWAGGNPHLQWFNHCSDKRRQLHGGWNDQ